MRVDCFHSKNPNKSSLLPRRRISKYHSFGLFSVHSKKNDCKNCGFWVRGTLAFLFLYLAEGVPYVLLQSSIAKCVHLDVAQELVVTIEYHAPDISIYNSDQGQAGSTPDQDMTLSLFQQSISDQSETQQNARKVPNKKVTGTKKSKVQIDREKGSLHFYTGNSAGILEICQQSFQATPENPRRIALNIIQRVASVQEQEKNTPIGSLSNSDTATGVALDEMKSNEHQTRQVLKAEPSRISLELHRLKALAHDLTLHADLAQQVQQDHYLASVHLHRAVRYWPIFRIFVAIVAGFVQVKLVIDYMKSRCIC